MPGLESTGPMGQGAQTGKRMGKCSGNSVDDTLPGRRSLRGAGRGIGRRNFDGNEENFGGRGRGRGRRIRLGMGWKQSQNDN